MSFTRFRPTSHFIGPHSWMNDPCGALFIPETQEYIFCYQWNPGTTSGGNGAWGMAKSKDLVTWVDCTPALTLGPTYDRLGVFSGSIVSRIVEGRRVLFLFYTSVAALPIHWSKPYLDGCETQSVAFSTDFGNSWHRYENNPLISTPPRGPLTTGWRDPFVSKWEALSTLTGADPETDYMVIASGERGRGPELRLYRSNNLLDWESAGKLLDVPANSMASPTSKVNFGMNFECASFFSIGKRQYVVLGIEEDKTSKKSDGHGLIWLSGNLVLESGEPKFEIKSHGLLDHGNAYAAHVFRDAEGRILQLGWANETSKSDVVEHQGWAGILTHPRELYEISRPASKLDGDEDRWDVDEQTGTMTTLGVRPAPQIKKFRHDNPSESLESFRTLRSKNYEIEATFTQLSGHEKLVFNVRESTSEVAKIVLDITAKQVTVDRSHSSLDNIGTNSPDAGDFHLFAGEDLNVRIFVDNSILEVYVNDRFALTSRIYPSLEASVGASYNFGEYDVRYVKFSCWEGLANAWPARNIEVIPEEALPSLEMKDEKTRMLSTVVPAPIYA